VNSTGRGQSQSSPQAQVQGQVQGQSRPRLPRKQARRSLKTLLLIWFLLLSLVPLMFVTGYSLVKYEKAIDLELEQRLNGNVRTVTQTVADSEAYLEKRRNVYRADTTLIYYLSTNAVSQARGRIAGLLRNSVVSNLSLFNSDGQLVSSLSQDESSNAKENRDIENGTVYLSDAYKDKLTKDGVMSVVETGSGNSLDLIMLTRLDAKNRRTAGYVEEIINLGPSFLENSKKRLGLEMILFDNKGNIVGGSHPDFALYPKDGFAKAVTANESRGFFDLNLRDEPYGFITAPVKWGESGFVIGLGASKKKARAVLQNVNYAFFTMLGAIGLLLIISSIAATRIIVKPIYDLVDGLQQTEIGDRPIEIPVSTDTEIGVLTESFNEMSQRIYQAKTELEKKIKELEKANVELKETQARLVHSTKMASLGQLVAGIAHELNNPIGFIYSNMTHLREYSGKLIEIIEAVEKNPKSLKDAKESADFGYIVEDLPRLITSCEEGARRTRDIVLGLRNFSRLEEAKIKKVSLKEGIENTLRLLSGELKNRVRVHTEFGEVPEVLCYASQLNQVFMNILTNASQAIEGEGDIWITLREELLVNQPARAVVSIRDSGKGMSSDVIDKIFDPFFTTKTVGQGTGLGMSISYGIVKKHGGDIQIHSEPGKGTEFLVAIPIDGPPGTDPAALV